MRTFLYHWVYLDLWVPLWTNLVASAIVGVLVWLKLRAIHRLHQVHLTLMQEVHASIAQPADDSQENTAYPSPGGSG